MNATVRNVLIVVGIAFLITVSTSASALAGVIGTLVRLLLLVAFAYLVYVYWRQNRYQIGLMPQRQQLLLYGAVAGIALLVLTSGLFLGSALSALLFFALLGACGYTLYRVWTDARRYY